MRLIRFLSRVALIFNFFFLLAVALHFYNFLPDDPILPTIVIAGYALAVFFFTPAVNICYILLIAFKKKIFNIVPRWLVITNFIFLILQIVYILLFLNDLLYY
jgi:hypothetical protein